MRDAETIKTELVRRIMEAAHPLRIILFGSAARDQMGPNSDLDVLVIMPDGVHRRQIAQTIYRHLLGFGVATDVIVATLGDIQRDGNNPALVYRNALTEGKELYHAAA
jgi:predicted nucleotidyltransferase